MSPSRTAEKRENFNPSDRIAWREWLSRNHSTSTGVWLTVRKKNTGEGGIMLEDAVEEAICFGWIDSKLHVADEKAYTLLFTPRKPGGIWARTNKARVEKLIREGLMMPAGLAKVEAAKRDGSWSRLDAVEDLLVPEDLRKALADAAAEKGYEAFRDSVKKQLLWWLESAKTQQTRLKRIQQIVAWAKEGGKNPFEKQS